MKTNLHAKRTQTARLLFALLLGLLCIPVRQSHAGAAAAKVPPLELLSRVRSHYQGLTSFEMRIRHRDSSGAYPGTFTQTLGWRKADQFELRVISGGTKQLPDFFADGRQVHAVFPNGKRHSESVAPPENSMPGWEVTGGVILGFLQNTESSRRIFDPPAKQTQRWSYGNRTTWNGKIVTELVVKVGMKDDPRTVSASFFIEPNTNVLCGFEWDGGTGKTSGSAVYEDQRTNPKLSTKLGQAPTDMKPSNKAGLPF